MLRGMAVTTNRSTREDFLAFFRQKIEASVSSDLDIEIEPQKLSQVEESLREARVLGEEDVLTNATVFAQTNEKISEEISGALPTAVILNLIEAYYQEHANRLVQIIQGKRKVIRKTAEAALAILVLSFPLLIGGSIFSFLSYSILALLTLILGVICGVLGLLLLQVNLAQRKDLSKTIEKEDLLDKLKVAQLLIEQITDEDRKNEAVKNFLASILKQNS
jgi:hypothetical protein